MFQSYRHRWWNSKPGSSGKDLNRERLRSYCCHTRSCCQLSHGFQVLTSQSTPISSHIWKTSSVFGSQCQNWQPASRTLFRNALDFCDIMDFRKLSHLLSDMNCGKMYRWRPGIQMLQMLLWVSWPLGCRTCWIKKGCNGSLEAPLIDLMITSIDYVYNMFLPVFYLCFLSCFDPPGPNQWDMAYPAPFYLRNARWSMLAPQRLLRTMLLDVWTFKYAGNPLYILSEK